jgi:hypothetical protein
MLYPVQRLPREALPMSAEITDELAAAIGWVAIEAATLEYFLAQVVATAWDWDEGTFRKALSKTAWLQDQFRRLAEEKQDPALLDIARAAEARLLDRHVVMHSVATVSADGDGERLGFYDFKVDREQPITLSTLQGQVFETRRTRRACERWLAEHG